MSIEYKSLLIEIGTEELPHTSLKTLGNEFQYLFHQQLFDAGFCQTSAARADDRILTSPRRLSVLLKNVASEKMGEAKIKLGPAVDHAFSDDGKPTPAALGFAKSCGVDFDQLDRENTDKGERLKYEIPGKMQKVVDILQEVLEKSLNGLPIAKRMRWGDHDHEFARPVKWLTCLLGDEVIPLTSFGLTAGNTTYGHRFHHPDAITIQHADEYVDALHQAYVCVNFATRVNQIKIQVNDVAESLKGTVNFTDDAVADTLTEVASLVEWPVTLAGKFEERFLEVPQEVLIKTMQDNQKYFPVLDAAGNLMADFIFVSHIESKDPSQVIGGNERVIRPRFADAAFFWEQDKNKPLESHYTKLADVVFEKQLGSIQEKAIRVGSLAATIATAIGADSDKTQRAAKLAKCDLMTETVVEFPSMQGIAGHRLAAHEGEDEVVASAIREAYYPRFGNDQLPSTGVALSVAIAERIDTIVGILGIGKAPTGSKDPYGLRRAAIGIVRMMVEEQIDVDLTELCTKAKALYKDKLTNADVVSDAIAYIIERQRGLTQSRADIDGNVSCILAVVETNTPANLYDIDQRIRAMRAFFDLTERESIAESNKRIKNILKKIDDIDALDLQTSLLEESAEKTLYDTMLTKESETQPLYANREYEKILTLLAPMQQPVDDFFDNVMVMTDDAALKNNRLALLNRLSKLFSGVGDLSYLQ